MGRGPEARSEAAVPPGRKREVRLGGALRQAWVGYQRMLGQEMTSAGFEQAGFPDGRVLRMCARSPEVTISRIGRELGVTRQGASKIVGVLRDRGFVTVSPSPADGREKVVALTGYAAQYLDAQRRAVRAIERRLTREIGHESIDALYALLDVLGGDDQPRLRDYLQARLTGPHLE